jgi:DNA polymerase-3 subunit epsilon
VLLCSSSHRIVLYNAQAADLLAGAGELGLDRPLFGLLREGPNRHAHGQLCRDGDDAAADLLCTTGEGGRVLQGQMRLIREEGAAVPSGYVLSLRDVTADLSSHAARERLLRDVVEEIRRPAANLRTTLDVIADPQLTDERRARLQAAVADEAGTLVARISDFGGRQDASARAWWPMADVPAGDIADALRATLEADGVTLEARTAPLLLRCDGYALVQLLAGAARSFAGAGSALTLVIEPEDQGAVIDLGWNGGPPSVAAVDEWLGAPLAGGYAGLTGRDALDSHGTELWPEATAAAGALLRLPIPAARAETRRPEHHRRPEFYDFGLLLDDASLIGDERPLESLKYVVFDTETTGLAPTRGDEIVQIAAVRIVNGRMLGGESLDMLVDPERAIPAASTRVHHITDEMVAGAPAIDEAGRRFHRFCEDAVMVAHNAPFDMAFLRRHEARMGVRFANPILDTVLLSAILYGQTAEHSLDAIAERLAVHIAPEERHTALGDAKATAEILLKMLPMLRETGLVTLGQTIREFRKHARLLRAVE